MQVEILQKIQNYCSIQTLVVHLVANTLLNDGHASNPLFQLYLTETPFTQ